ncbi:MAG: hypothetical protein ACRDGL_04135 [Candidatus Limnocylindrales bacterium]
MTNNEQPFVMDRRAALGSADPILPAITHPGASPQYGEPTMIPFYQATAADRQRELLREADREHLARVALAARRDHQPERGFVRELRLAMGVALVRSGEAILPREDCCPERAF